MQMQPLAPENPTAAVVDSRLVAQNPHGLDVAATSALAQPLIENTGAVHDGRRCAKVVTCLSCFMSLLLFTVAAFMTVCHYGHIHVLHKFHDLQLHMHWPLQLVVVLVPALYCCMAGLVTFCVNRRQCSASTTDEPSAHRAKRSVCSLMCLVFGVLAISFAIVVMICHKAHVHMHFAHVSCHTLRIITTSSLVIGAVCIVASMVLCKRQASARSSLADAPTMSQRSSCCKKAVIVLCIVVGLVLAGVVILRAAHVHIHLPFSHHHGHVGHFDDQHGHHRGHHVHHGDHYADHHGDIEHHFGHSVQHDEQWPQESEAFTVGHVGHPHDKHGHHHSHHHGHAFSQADFTEHIVV
jgi:hypothetical protein